MMDQSVALWMGKPVKDMTREELIDALNWSAREIRKMQDDHRIELAVLGGRRNAK